MELDSWGGNGDRSPAPRCRWRASKLSPVPEEIYLFDFLGSSAVTNAASALSQVLSLALVVAAATVAGRFRMLPPLTAHPGPERIVAKDGKHHEWSVELAVRGCS